MLHITLWQQVHTVHVRQYCVTRSKVNREILNAMLPEIQNIRPILSFVSARTALPLKRFEKKRKTGKILHLESECTYLELNHVWKYLKMHIHSYLKFLVRDPLV